MNILLLNYEYPPLGGGGGVGSHKLATAWVQLGHTVTVITSGSKHTPKHEIKDGVEVLRVNSFLRKERATASIFAQFLYLIFGFLKCITICKQRKIDIINTHFAVPTGPLGLVVSKLFNIPNALTIIGADIYDPSRFTFDRYSQTRTINRMIIDSADQVVALSTDISNRAKKIYNIKKQPQVINYPYKHQKHKAVERRVLGLNENDFYMISIGRLVKRKCFHTLLYAMSKINNNNLKLLILGDGPLEQELKKLTTQLELSSQVIFLGFVTGVKKFQYLEAADLFVLSSSHEGLGIVVQEAMGAQLPIISTNTGGQTDLLKNNYNALLIKPESPEQLSSAIKQMLTNKKLRDKLGANNQKAIEKYEPKVIGGKYISLFQSVLK